MVSTGGKINIECSPRTFHRIENDPQYRDQITQEVMQSQGEDFEEITVSQSQSSENEEQIFHENEEQKTNWLEAPTKLLLSLCEELMGKSQKFKTKKKMWAHITNELVQNGYNFTEAQVHSKYRSLERQYKKTKLHNSKTGRDRKTCIYKNELDQVLGERRGINPEYTPHSEENNGTSREELLRRDAEADNTFDEDDPTLPSTSRSFRIDDSEEESSQSIPKRRRVGSVQERILQKVEEMQKERNTYQNKVLNFLQDREKAREERSKQKLVLMESMLKIIRERKD